MKRATWNGKTIAESDRTVVVDGNHYFPIDDVNMEFFEESSTTTVCGWKGTANYYHVKVDGQHNDDAAWVYRTPKPEASEIEGNLAFWRGVEVG